MEAWLYDEAPVWLIALAVILLQLGAVGLGMRMRRRFRGERSEDDKSADQLITSAILGLLALLLAFTSAMALDRFDARRVLVAQEANAIGTTWLRAQLFDEPHRSRLSRLLEAYAGNRLALGRVTNSDERRALLARNDRYLQLLWTETRSAVWPVRGLETAQGFVESMNATIDMAATRKAARRAHVPNRLLVALLLYMSIAAFAVGTAVQRLRGHWGANTLLVLMTLTYLLILDIDHPNRGGIRERQTPMEDLIATMRASPPASYGH
jgi:hypothetical protein